VFVFILCFGCGRKAPPRWVEPSQPLPPQNLNAIARPDSVTLFWQLSPKVDGVTVKGYAVYRALDDGQFEEIGFVNGSSYEDKAIEQDAGYVYKVIARPVEDGPESEPVSINASVLAGLDPPQNLNASIDAEGVVLTWDIDENASGYRVFKSYEAGDAPGAQVDSGLVTSGVFRAKAEPEQSVYYHLSAVRDDGAVVTESATSAQVEISPSMFVPAAPESVAAVYSEQKVLVFWDVSPEKWVSGYRVFRAVGDKGSFEPIGDSMTLAFPDNDPPVGKLRYRVSALVSGQEGTPSAEAPVTVKAE
jgi:fibronectin type 3 domain-containing protein